MIVVSANGAGGRHAGVCRAIYPRFEILNHRDGFMIKRAFIACLLLWAMQIDFVYATTAANMHDSQVFKQLVDKEDNALLADAAYSSEQNEAYLLHECDCNEFMQIKAKPKVGLTAEQKCLNKARSRIRVRIEHIFGRMSQMGMHRLRTIGLVRAHQHNGLCNLLYNMDRYAFLCPNTAI